MSWFLAIDLNHFTYNKNLILTNDSIKGRGYANCCHLTASKYIIPILTEQSRSFFKPFKRLTAAWMLVDIKQTDVDWCTQPHSLCYWPHEQQRSAAVVLVLAAHGQSLRFKAYPVTNAEIFLSRSYSMAEETETLSSVISSILPKRQILPTKLSFEDFTHECTMIIEKKVFTVANYDRFQFPRCITFNLLYPEDDETLIPLSLRVSHW